MKNNKDHRNQMQNIIEQTPSQKHWEKNRVQKLRDGYTYNSNPNETIFELFTRVAHKRNAALFKEELLFAGTKLYCDEEDTYIGGSGLERIYEELKENQKSFVTLENYAKFKNGFYVNTKSSTIVEEPLSNISCTLMYLHLLAFEHGKKEFTKELNSLNEKQIKGSEQDKFKKLFSSAIKNLLQEKENSQAKEKYLVKLLNDIVVPHSKDALASTIRELSSFLYQTFKNTLLRTYYQSHFPDICIQRTTLASELGLGILNYIVDIKVNNGKLNMFINKLRPENLHSMTENTRNMLKDFLIVMQSNNTEYKQAFCEKAFAYKKINIEGVLVVEKEINILYQDFILDYLYDLVYDFYKNHTKYFLNILKEFKIQNPFTTYKRTFFINTVYFGNVILNNLIAENICTEKLIDRKQKTVSMIYIAEKTSVISLNTLYGINQPQILTQPLSPPKVKQVLEKLKDLPILKEINTNDVFHQYLIQQEFKNQSVHKSQTLSLKFKLNPDEHNYTPKKKYKLEFETLKLFLQGLIRCALPPKKEEVTQKEEEQLRLTLSYDALKTFLNSTKNHAFCTYKLSENILTFYDLTFPQLNILLNKYERSYENNKYHDALYQIVCFMLDYTELGFSTLYNNLLGKYADTEYKGFLDIKSLVDKVLQYKTNLVGLIKHSILYSRFSFFVAFSFLDSRGRIYNSESFLNIQNNPTSKMFISIYQDKTQELSLETIEILQQTFAHSSKNLKDQNLFVFNQLEKFDLASLNERHYNIICTLDDICYKLDYKINTNKEEENLKKEKIDLMADLFLLNRKKNTLLHDFLLKNRDLCKQFIKNHFNKTLSEKVFNTFLKACGYRTYLLPKQVGHKTKQKYLTRFQQLEFIKKHIKKTRKTWAVLKEIINLCKRTNTNFIAEFDCNNSGSQNIGILLENEMIARQANLIGVEDFDAYTHVLNSYNTLITDLQKVLLQIITIQKIPNIFDDENLELCFVNSMIKPNHPKENLLLMLTHNIQDSPGLILLLETCFAIPNISFSVSEISKFYCLIPNIEKNIITKLITNKFKKEFRDFCMFILVLRVAVRLQIYFIKFPWLSPTSDVWKERDIFKKPLMTSYYNATRYTRISHFQSFFLEYSQHYQQVTSVEDFYYLGDSLELFFTSYSETNLLGLKYMKNLTKRLLNNVTKEKKITIENNYFRIEMLSTAYKSVQIETKTLQNKRQQLSIMIQDTTKVDKKSLELSISPNIIHSMDAHLVHYFNARLKALNEKLWQSSKDQRALNFKQYNGIVQTPRPFQIVFYTNHDNFACNVPIILPLLLQQAYHDLMLQRYIFRIQPLSQEELLEFQSMANFMQQDSLANLFLESTNPKFIK